MSEKPNWKSIDPNSLPKDHKALYEAYKAARKIANDAKRAFETRMNSDARLGAGKALVFGYNFGKLAIAVVDKAVEKPKASAKVLSLVDYLQEARVA